MSHELITLLQGMGNSLFTQFLEFIEFFLCFIGKFLMRLLQRISIVGHFA
jgi:hypothetical protein